MKKYLLFCVLALTGGMLGAYIFSQSSELFGATTARTTITNPWTYSATTTMNANLTITTTNAATSTVQVGCVQTTATSTATPIRLTFSLPTQLAGTSTTQGTASIGNVVWQYGSCPKI